MSKEHIEIDGESLNNTAQPERIVISIDDLPPEEPAVPPRQYPGLDAKQGVGIIEKKTVLADIGGSQVKQNLLAGLIGGFIAWAITETIYGEQQRQVGGVNLLLYIGFWGAIIGSAIGGVLGSADGITSKVREKAITGGAIGVGIGLIGGLLGGLCGQILYGYLGGGIAGSAGEQIFARTTGWALLGLFIGLAQGASGRSMKKVVNGLIGGMIGGAIGGLAFDMLSGVSHTALISRMFGITVLGGLSGAAIGMVEEARKEAWLRVVDGPQNGKQFIIYANITRIGSSPKCEIVLIKDPQVAPEQCRIVCNVNAYYLECPVGVTIGVNGAPINKTRLKRGDVLTIGQSRLVYEDKVATPIVSGGISR